MYVASIDLCKTLFEMSGWGKSHRPHGMQLYAVSKNGEYLGITGDKFLLKDFDKFVPAYDLGFILRKLPEIRLETWHNGQVVIKYYTVSGVPSKLERKGKIVKAEADTPEDAACRLAIILFEQGVLVKEEG